MTGCSESAGIFDGSGFSDGSDIRLQHLASLNILSRGTRFVSVFFVSQMIDHTIRRIGDQRLLSFLRFKDLEILGLVE